MLSAAADAIRTAEVFIITAGAGMGVDSGLPDFRGNEGFWNAYPPYARLGVSFVECANPEHFQRDPAFGWGFYGHRTNLYRDTIPHEGFHILKQWADRANAATFVVTSNVDGQFQKAGYPDDAILEVHGSIHWLQCATPCCRRIWENREQIPVNLDTMRARSIPRCPACQGVSRPNILMFGDWSWLSERTEAQQGRFDDFLAAHYGKRTVVIEMGAGKAVPTIRYLSERLGNRRVTTVIRINPREPEIDAPHIPLRAGALEGLRMVGDLTGKPQVP